MKAASTRKALISDVDHIGVVVADADTALGFYVGALGLELIEDEVLVEKSARLVYLDAGNVLIQLVQPLGDGPLADFLAQHGEGLHHVCLSVDSIEDTLVILGGTASDGIFQGGRGRRACFLGERPNGILVELYENPTSCP